MGRAPFGAMVVKQRGKAPQECSRAAALAPGLQPGLEGGDVPYLPIRWRQQIRRQRLHPRIEDVAVVEALRAKFSF